MTTNVQDMTDEYVTALRDRIIEITLLDAAKMLYTAYGNDANWLTHDNKPMPTWEDLPPIVARHWLAGVRDILVIKIT